MCYSLVYWYILTKEDVLQNFVWTGFYMIDMIGTSAMKKRNSVMFILTMTVAKAIWNVRVLWMDSKRFNASYISPLVLIILQYLLLLSNLERWVIFFLSHQAGLSLTDVKISNYELKFWVFFLWKHFITAGYWPMARQAFFPLNYNFKSNKHAKTELKTQTS